MHLAVLYIHPPTILVSSPSLPPIPHQCLPNEAVNETTIFPLTVLETFRELFALDALPIYRLNSFSHYSNSLFNISPLGLGGESL